MRKRLTLEPEVIQYLIDHGSSPIDSLLKSLHKKTGVAEEKIEFRIKKMAKQNKIKLSGKYVLLGEITKEESVQNYDEVFELGPIKVARKGRIISIQTQWTKEEHKKFVRVTREKLPELKKDLEDKFQNIEKLILENFDPLDVLAYVSAKNLLGDPETYTESSFQGKQLFPEIIQNVVLKNQIEKYGTETNRDKISQIDGYLSSLFSILINYISADTLVRTDLAPVEKDIYIRVLFNFLMLRGDAYPQHYKEIALELFSKIKDILELKGFTIEEYWSTLEELWRQIQYNYNEPPKRLFEEYSKFVEFASEEENKGTSPKEIIEKFKADFASRKKEIDPILRKLTDLLLKGSFEIEINNRINQKLLGLLSMNFGDNCGWNSPLDKSDIAIKPIIRINGKYYCFLVVHLLRNVIQIIESILSDAKKQQIRYSDIKGDFFEEKALKLLGDLIKGKTYHNLKYPKGNEIDGVIVLNNLVFLIEIKGRKRRIVAGVSDVLKLAKEDFEAHINEAFEQTKKALNYINSKNMVEFKDEKGTVVLKLQKGAIKKVYLINVTLENFSDLCLNLNMVKTWDSNLIKGNQYPWIISIYDLLVINELLEKQTNAFLKYLDERIEVERENTLQAIDELDYFGYFLDHGSLAKEKNLKDLKSLLIHGYSEKIDRWYSYLRGEVKSAEKPTLKTL